MAKWKSIKSQVLASTHQDAQGESQTVECLNRLAALFSKNGRMPLHQHHDMTLDSVGHIENFRVIPDGADSEHWVLVGDVSFRDIDIDEALRGFSYSITDQLVGSSKPSAAVFLPYPYYNDTSLLSDLTEGQPDIAAGAWRKKGADPNQISLIIGFVLFIAAPAYTNYWNSTIGPLLSKLRGSLTKVQSVEFCQTLTGPRGETCAAYFIPPRGGSTDLITLSLVVDALERANTFIHADSLARERGVYLVKLSYYGSRYEIASLQYLDGSVVYHRVPDASS